MQTIQASTTTEPAMKHLNLVVIMFQLKLFPRMGAYLQPLQFFVDSNNPKAMSIFNSRVSP